MSNKLHTTAETREEYDATNEVGVFVVDDHDGYRVLVGEVIAATSGFAVAGGAGSWTAAEDELRRLATPPQLVLMDVNLGDESGIEAAHQLSARSPDVKIILISTLAIDDLPDNSQRCGASAFLPKSLLSPREIVRAWRGAYDWEQ